MTRMYEPGAADGAYRILELPGRGAPYDAREAAFMDSGACRGTDPATGRVFEPVIWDTDTRKGRTSMRGTVVFRGRERSRREAVGLAREVCGGCVVRGECREFIMRYPEGEGVWAGMVPEERRAA